MKTSFSNTSWSNRGSLPGCVRPVAAAWLTAAMAGVLSAANPTRPAKNFGDLNIEELMNETVTSVSKHEQRLVDSAAAIAVLSNDDLRRSGATAIMEALRLVPGVNVAQVNASEWAISARGFNSVFSNKLLVLVDGRAIYSPLFAGVYWDTQQVMLDDVDRVEVIRGPGATVWGANAVNGVINVVSKSARESQGGLLSGGGGDQHAWLGGMRYGGQVGASTYYRVFGSYRDERDFPLADGAGAGDGWQGRQGGFRVDHYSTADTHLTWQADATSVKHDHDAFDADSFNTLGRWTRQLSASATVEVQAYYDRVSRYEPARADTHSDTVDFTAQHTFGLGERHDIIWGGGYRHVANTLGPTTPFIQVRRAHSRQQLFSGFLQDEFQLIPDRLTFTAGGKLEHNEYTGWEFQPSLRAVFKPTAGSTVWAAISRSVRTPDAIEGKDVLGVTAGAPFPGPDGGFYFPTIVGNADPTSEILRAYELGYRVHASRRVTLDLAVFYNEYSMLIGVDGVRRFVPGVPFGIAETPFVNVQRGETYGGEASLTVSPHDRWRLTATYARIAVHLRGAAAMPAAGDLSSPEHQVGLRSSHDLTARTTLDVQLRHVSEIPGVDAYTATDFRLAYRWSDHVELSLVGQNLFDPRHPEAGPQQFTVTTEVPRQFYGKVTWRF